MTLVYVLLALAAGIVAVLAGWLIGRLIIRITFHRDPRPGVYGREWGNRP